MFVQNEKKNTVRIIIEIKAIGAKFVCLFVAQIQITTDRTKYWRLRNYFNTHYSNLLVNKS